MHGPFPIKHGRLFFALLALVMGGLLGALWFNTQILSCDGDRCTLSERGPLASPTRRFARTRLLRARVEARDKGRGVAVLELGGEELRLHPVSLDEAEELARAINEALAAGAPIQRKISQPWSLLAFAVAFPVAALALLHNATRGMGRYHIRWEAPQRRLVVSRRILGLPMGEHIVAIDRVADVEVDWQRQRDFFHRSHEPGDTVGRLVLIDGRAGRVPITPRCHRGYTVHLEAERRLRRLLDCEPRSEARRAELEEAARHAHPPPSFAGAMGRFGAAWLGACCGALGGMVLYGLVGFALGLLRGGDALSGYAAGVGGGGGAVLGIALALYLTRPRPPR